MCGLHKFHKWYRRTSKFGKQFSAHLTTLHLVQNRKSISLKKVKMAWVLGSRFKEKMQIFYAKIRFSFSNLFRPSLHEGVGIRLFLLPPLPIIILPWRSLRIASIFDRRLLSCYYLSLQSACRSSPIVDSTLENSGKVLRIFTGTATQMFQSVSP